MIPLNEIPAISRSLKGTLEHVPQLTRIVLTDADGGVLGFAQRPGAGILAAVSTELKTGSQQIGTLEVEAAPPCPERFARRPC